MSVSALSSGVAKLNPFGKGSHKKDEDDQGERVDAGTVAGGGHSARQTAVTKNQLRISHALRSFLASHKVIGEDEIGPEDSDQLTPAVRALVDKPHINVPASVTDRSHPLPDYFISSSHNTYLLAHQLYGKSDAEAYEEALTAGARCVEIDAWDNDADKDEPKVTHGFTLVSNIPFRKVCETIRDVVDKEAAESINEQGYRAAPILLSLENHCDAHGQARLVAIMKEVFGDRLLSEAVREKGHAEQLGGGEHVCLSDLGSKVCVIVEYHLPDEADDSSDSDSSSSSSEDEAEKSSRKKYKAQKKDAPATGIVPELAALGVYAQSVKPGKRLWYNEIELADGPHHPLFNLSESGLGGHLPGASAKIARHNAHHLMRVYPKGTRISSANLPPVPFWGVGAQICALNWQTFGASMQLNEALFSGSDGYVLKPAALRSRGGEQAAPAPPSRNKKLRLHVAGATDVPLPADRAPDEIKPYLTCVLVHPADLADEPPKRKTTPYRQHKLGFLHRGPNPPAADPVWDEVLEWEYEDSELAFVRLLVKSDDSFARNPVLAVAAVRLLNAVDEWRFIRLLDLKGHETRCSLLVRFELVDA